MLAPFAFVSRRDMQVQRLIDHTDRYRGNYHRLRKDDLRLWHIADINASVQAGLAYADGYADIGGQRRVRADCQQGGGDQVFDFHVYSPSETGGAVWFECPQCKHRIALSAIVCLVGAAQAGRRPSWSGANLFCANCKYSYI